MPRPALIQKVRLIQLLQCLLNSTSPLVAKQAQLALQPQPRLIKIAIPYGQVYLVVANYCASWETFTEHAVVVQAGVVAEARVAEASVERVDVPPSRTGFSGMPGAHGGPGHVVNIDTVSTAHACR